MEDQLLDSTVNGREYGYPSMCISDGTYFVASKKVEDHPKKEVLHVTHTLMDKALPCTAFHML